MTNIEKKEPRPVLISVRGEQDYTDADSDATELMTEGTLTETDDGGLRIAYEESTLTGMEGTTTAFEIRGGQVSLTRTGKVNSRMVFEEGRQHTSLYETPFGALSVDIQTGFLKSTMTSRGGLMEIRYTISVEHAVTGRNRFRIRVREKH